MNSQLNINILKAKLLEKEVIEKGIPMPTLQPISLPDLSL